MAGALTEVTDNNFAAEVLEALEDSVIRDARAGAGPAPVARPVPRRARVARARTNDPASVEPVRMRETVIGNRTDEERRREE